MDGDGEREKHDLFQGEEVELGIGCESTMPGVGYTLRFEVLEGSGAHTRMCTRT